MFCLRHCSRLQVAFREELNVSRFYWDFTCSHPPEWHSCHLKSLDVDGERHWIEWMPGLFMGATLRQDLHEPVSLITDSTQWQLPARTQSDP